MQIFRPVQPVVLAAEGKLVLGAFICDRVKLYLLNFFFETAWNLPYNVFSPQGDDVIVRKLRDYDNVLKDNVDVRTQLKAVSLEKEKLQTEVEKVSDFARCINRGL